MVAIMSVGFVSCDDNDDATANETSSNSSFVGLWRHDFSSGYHLMSFNSDNTGYQQEYDESDGKLRKRHDFTWKYIESQRHLEIVESDGDTDVFTVMYINKTEMEIIDPDGYSNKYLRVN